MSTSIVTPAPAPGRTSTPAPGEVLESRPSPEEVLPGALRSALRKGSVALPSRVDVHRLRLENLRLAAELVQAHQARDDFLAVASHELRTPLTSILGFLELLTADMARNKAEERQLLEGALESARDLHRVINDILQMAELESGEAVATPQAFDLADTTKGTLRLFQEVAVSKGLNLHMHEPPPILPMAWGDVPKVQIVLRHVLSNALKFTPTGQVAVSLDHDREPDLVRVLVTDTGIGFPPEQCDSLTQAFRQLEDPAVRHHGGAGLGLAIATRLLEIMNGRLTLHSPGVGRGATVTIALPAAR